MFGKSQNYSRSSAPAETPASGRARPKGRAAEAATPHAQRKPWGLPNLQPLHDASGGGSAQQPVWAHMRR